MNKTEMINELKKKGKELVFVKNETLGCRYGGTANGIIHSVEKCDDNDIFEFIK